MRVVGIDLGSICSGYGIVEKNGHNFSCINWGEIKLPRKDSLAKRLYMLYDSMEEIFKAYTPHEVVIEDPYVGSNVKTAFVLGQVKGVTVLLAQKLSLPVFAYSPLEIKQAVVGYGRADKGQVRAMVQKLLSLPDMPGQHAADALAAALCHLQRLRL
ncbi:MAG: crossover junction endodeoxyribonuclease RuvC [Candidatus Desulfofervidaceae bacterium]|nr:crossover junction endodeoxyribonuclease RuvC [Candidatus Desulfofervidaceae bacterium]